jgi:hypothetical protein
VNGERKSRCMLYRKKKAAQMGEEGHERYRDGERERERELERERES